MNYIGIIPARYASTRFPGKPLAMLGGKPVIQRVYEQVSGVMDDVLVATGDELDSQDGRRIRRQGRHDPCGPQERHGPLL